MAFNLRHILKLARQPVLRYETSIILKSNQTSNYHTKKSSYLCLNHSSTTSIQHRRNIHNNSAQETVLNTDSGTFPVTSQTSLEPTYSAFQDPLDTTLSTLSTPIDTTLSPLEPTLASLGLGGWTPKGWVQQSLEFLHVHLDVPWWSAIVIGTICIRIAIFPLVIASQRNIANLNNHMPTITRFQERITQARSTGNMQEMVSSSNEMMAFMKTNNVNPIKNMLVPLAQLPIFISVFTGLREMALLPVVSMVTGGLWWFSDLTIADPICVLPAVTALTLLITIEAGVDGVKASQTGSVRLKWFLRCMPFISLPVMINFPAAMLCYWFTSNSFSLCQVMLLKIPQVRSFFGIPVVVDHSTAYPLKKTTSTNTPPQSFMQSFRESMKNIELAHEIDQREKMKALKMKKPETKDTQIKDTKIKDKM